MSTARKAEILIVDDEANTLSSLARAFRLAGHEATVCDNAANEVCPFWPGQPMTAHWGIPDPAAIKGTPEEIARAFRDAFTVLDRRIGLFLSLPFSTLDQLAIKREVENIGCS